MEQDNIGWLHAVTAFWPVIVLTGAVIVGYVELRGKVKTNYKVLQKHESLLTSGIAGGAPFLTEPEHDKLQNSCQAKIESQIHNIEKDMSSMKETMKEGDECRKESREESTIQFAALRKEFNEHHTNVAVMVAGIQSDIKNLTKRGL